MDATPAALLQSVGERLQVGLRKSFTQEQLAGIKWDAETDHVFDAVAVRMVRELIAYEIPPETREIMQTQVVYTPASWWDMWKFEHRSWRIAKWLKPPRYDKQSIPTLTYVTKQYEVNPCYVALPGSSRVFALPGRGQSFPERHASLNFPSPVGRSSTQRSVEEPST